jgi:hypothetical protein
MVCDGKEGVNPLDLVLADWMRRNNKVPLYLAGYIFPGHEYIFLIDFILYYVVLAGPY